MAKKKKNFKKHRIRNAARRARRARSKPDDETPLKRLAMTAAGAAGTALVGSFLVARGLGAEDDLHGAHRGRRGSRVEGRRADRAQHRRRRRCRRRAVSSR